MSDLHHERVDINSMPPAPTDETVVIPPPEHRDDKHDKKRLGRRIVAGTALAAVLGGGAFVGAKAFGGNDKSSDNNGKKPETATMTVTNVAGDELTVKSENGEPFSDLNFNGKNDFSEDANHDDIPDGLEYNTAGEQIDPPQTTPETTPETTNEINNTLPDDKIDFILQVYPSLLEIYPDAVDIIHSWKDNDRAWGLYVMAQKYENDPLSGNPVGFFDDDNWKDLIVSQ